MNIFRYIFEEMSPFIYRSIYKLLISSQQLLEMAISLLTSSLPSPLSLLTSKFYPGRGGGKEEGEKEGGKGKERASFEEFQIATGELQEVRRVRLGWRLLLLFVVVGRGGEREGGKRGEEIFNFFFFFWIGFFGRFERRRTTIILDKYR